MGLFVGYITFVPTSLKKFMLPIVNDDKKKPLRAASKKQMARTIRAARRK
jgi:hypothetical protein